MKLVKESVDVRDILNPRGALAKELETTCRRAAWLSLLCAYWLSYHGDNAEAARSREPSYKLPPSFPTAKRINTAMKGCGAYQGRSLKGGYESPFAYRWDWAWVFDYWYSGGLDRGIKVLMGMLPGQNVEAIEKELML